MARRLARVIAAALLLGAAPSASARPVPPQQREQVNRYEVVLQSEPIGGGLQRHRVVGLFDATPEEIFRVATGYDRYSEYMPRITTSHTVWQGGDGSVVLIAADLPWPMTDSWVHARFLHDQPADGSYRVRFSMVRGNLQRYEGAMLIEPSGPGHAVVTYEIVAQPDSRIPRTLIQGAVGRGALNFVHCLRSRVAQLLHRGLLHGPAGATLYPLVLRPRGDDATPEEPSEGQD